MDKKPLLLKAILEQGMLPLFFHKSETVTLEITRTVYNAGVRVIEYTNRGKEALNNFIKLRGEVDKNMPDLLLGIGTIKTPEEAQQYIDAGTDFIVCPTINPEVAEKANQNGLLWIPGCMTPTEIALAQKNGAALTKIFPANILGPEFISSIKSLFPGQLFMPTGGVDLSRDNIATWFKAGVSAVGMGSKLISNSILDDQLYDILFQRTTETLQLVKEVKASLMKPVH